LKIGINNSVKRLASHQFRVGMASGVMMAVTEPVAVIMIMIIVAVQVIYLKEPLAPILVSIFLFNRALNAAIGIQRVWQHLLEQSGSIELLDRELSLPRDPPDLSRKQSIGPLAKAIELKGVCFAYPEGNGDVLKDMSLRIPSFTSVALVGESGSGKSTLVDLIALIHEPREGSISIDDIPGEQIAPASWRKQIGYVSQDTVIFDDTIANNISLWAGDFSKERELKDRIVDAARKAHIDHVIESLPEGYATRIGDRGLRLSAGQRQRLSIARELFRNPNLLILDEATSALDSESEHAIQKSIDELRGKITTIIIAHRFSTIQNVDQILVLDDGRIVEQGKFDELKFAAEGKFGRLLSRQLL
jgi:subfamily B ATP-binding cassette protein MsbA